MFTKYVNNQGTGSCPPADQGWQLKIRLMARYPPLNKPCFCKASRL